ncbi:MAG TPA: ATP-binding protein [Kofleriaceae bacterium]|jgi:hypothetical protein|nr:ATP-binding protein [Kofleriaceae bacterium]
MTAGKDFQNPFRPGAGHPPPYLAGRREETKEFERLLAQPVLLENLVLTGLRGVGKTVLLDTFKPLAQRQNWLWVGTDLSESTSVSEERIAIRLITDLATVTSSIVLTESSRRAVGFIPATKTVKLTLTYDVLSTVYEKTPGLVADKLKAVLQLAWQGITSTKNPARGLVFAYDEAQNLSDQAEKEQYPLSLLLDVFQSLQKQGMRMLLVLVGLPTLFPKLVDARTFAERMFRVVFLKRLPDADSREAILKPISDAACPVRLTEPSVKLIVDQSGGYPYFIQFICREVYDAFLASVRATGQLGSVPSDAITRKLDSDFFAGRWARVTDRQRELLFVIAGLEDPDDEFTVQEVVDAAKVKLAKGFSSSHVSQMLSALSAAGLVYKNRHGKYSFAVPMFGQFVLRQMQ